MTITAQPWQATIVDQLGQQTIDDGIPPDATHAAVFIPADDNITPLLLGCGESEIAAVVIGEDQAAPLELDGQVQVVKLDDLYRWHRAQAAGDELPDIDGTTIEPRRQNVETEEGDEIEQPTPDEDDEPDEAEIEPQSLAAPPVDPDGQTKAFDDSDYEREDLQIPKVDGETIDKIRVDFSGSVLLDRSAVADVALINGMRLGQELDLRVAGKVSSVGTGFTTNRDGDLDVVVLSKKLKVETVWVLDPEELRS